MVAVFRANLLVVVLVYSATKSSACQVCLGCPHTKQNRGFASDFCFLWQHLFLGFAHYFQEPEFARGASARRSYFVVPERLSLARNNILIFTAK